MPPEEMRLFVFLKSSHPGEHGADCLMWRNHDACVPCILAFARMLVAEERERCRLLACKAADDYEADLTQKDRDREAAVAEEREACAKIADAENDGVEMENAAGIAVNAVAATIAARIRARGDQVNRPPGSPGGD